MHYSRSHRMWGWAKNRVREDPSARLCLTADGSHSLSACTKALHRFCYGKPFHTCKIKQMMFSLGDEAAMWKLLTLNPYQAPSTSKALKGAVLFRLLLKKD